MSADYIIQAQEDECREAVQKNLLREVAVHIACGMPEKASIDHVTKVAYLRKEAEQSDNVFRDGDGFVDRYIESELEPPSEKELNKYQIDAIYQRLVNKDIEIVT